MTDIRGLEPSDITGVILAGGAGRRAGGRDKGLIDWEGRPLVAHVAERLEPQCGSLLVSCNRNLDRYAAYGTPVTDQLAGYQGPLAGLHAAAPHINTPLTLVCPCDVPDIPGDLAVTLAAALDTSGTPAAHARTDGRDHYCCALIRTEALGTLQEFLEGGGRAVRAWYETVGRVAVDFDTDVSSFRNMNSPG